MDPCKNNQKNNKAYYEYVFRASCWSQEDISRTHRKCNLWIKGSG